MRAGELKLEFRPGGQKARLSSAVPAPERLVARLRWQPHAEVDVPTALDAFERHLRPARVSIALNEHDLRSAPALAREALGRQPDALVVFETPPRYQAPLPKLSLPLRCAGLAGRPGPRFDEFAAAVSARGLLAHETTDAEGLRRSAAHVLHLSADERDDLDAMVGRFWSLEGLPALVVLEWRGAGADDGALLSRLAHLGGVGCGAVLALKGGDGPGGFDGAVARLYRMIAHDQPLDAIARDLSGQGHGVLLALSGPDAEYGVSLRRAVLEHPRPPGPRLEDALRWEPKPPQSELEELLAPQAAHAMAGLARIAREVSALEVMREGGSVAAPGGEQAEEIAAVARLDEQSRLADAIVGGAALALGWSLARPVVRVRGPLESFDPKATDPADPRTERRGPAVMPARALRALLHRDGEPLAGGVRTGEAFGLDVSIDFVEQIYALRLPGVIASIEPEALARAFGDAEAIAIELTVWAPAEHFEVRCESPRLSLPKMGESDKARFELRALELPPDVDEAVRRLRVGAYHRNRLLQSLVIDVAVGRTRTPGLEPAHVYDYAVSDEFLTAGEGPERRLSLFINDGADGSHWIGARSPGSLAAHKSPLVLSHQKAEQIAAIVHDALRAASALGDDDRYAAPLAQVDASDRAARELRLVELAKAGRRLYTTLSAGGGGLREARAALGPPDGHVEVARCRDDAPALPWQLVYDLELSVHGPATLCKLYKGQHGGSGDPGECASQAGCPHREALGQIGKSSAEVPSQPGEPSAEAPEAETMVCPFGFWGARHKLAQPISSRSGITVPTRKPSGRRGVTVGYFAFENADDHVGRIAPGAGPQNAPTRSAKTLKKYLRERDDALIYLYCHGRDENGDFFLEIGPENEARQLLSAHDLSNLTLGGQADWRHGPIVVLNGCETLRVQPTALNELLGELRNLGAAAIIGPEIAMFTTSAAKVGEAIVAGALEGVALDEVMLRIRRELLRELSPMGLAYNVYAPSGLAWSPPGEAAPGP